MSRLRIDSADIRDADLFQILLDNFPDMIHSIDTSGNIVYANRKATELLGYAHEELLSMNVRQIYADQVLESLETGFSNLKQEGEMSVESLLKAKDGGEIPVEIRSFSIYRDDGTFLRTFSILRDIRAIKELRKGLVHAGRLAAIGELASGVAHDINNPLTVILMSNEVCIRILEQAEFPETENVGRLKSSTRDVERATESIRNLVDHLRTFSRGVAETYTPIDVFDSIGDALFIDKNKIMECGVTVINRVSKGLYYVNGSRNQLEQVFVNLISNACDAMIERPERELTFSVGSAERDDRDILRFDVSDTGTGMPQKLLDEVFESFFTTKPAGEGTGLGLPISRTIIQEHGGDIEVESEPDKGTTIAVYLPRVAPDQDKANP